MEVRRKTESERHFEAFQWQIMLICEHKTCCGQHILLDYIKWTHVDIKRRDGSILSIISGAKQ